MILSKKYFIYNIQKKIDHTLLSAFPKFNLNENTLNTYEQWNNIAKNILNPIGKKI